MEQLLTQKAIDALLAVREAIAIDGGKSFDMGHFCNVTPCRTVMCIAGHLAFYAGASPRMVGQGPVQEELFYLGGFLYSAAEIVWSRFHLSGDMMRQLFYVAQWPVDLNAAYLSAAIRGNRLEMVRVSQIAIDRFILKYSPSEREREQAQPVETAEESVDIRC